MFPRGCAECGVMDMSGNVWEWCQTRYWDEDSKQYPALWADDGRENVRGGDSVWRILKGGSYTKDRTNVRLPVRYRDIPVNDWHRQIGVRVVVPITVH